MKKQETQREMWVGYRPSVMPEKKKNKKIERKLNKQLCRGIKKGGDCE